MSNNTSKRCSVKGCQRTYACKSFCQYHYLKNRRNGGPEIVKQHGLGKPPEYSSWNRMKQRCLNPNSTRYESWGGRGIKICPQWVNDFAQFYRDMGPKPSPKHSLDRIDNDGDYTPENCRWASTLEQARNKRPRKSSQKVCI